MSKAKGILSNYVRLALLFLVVVAVIRMIISNFDVAGNVLKVVVGFGLVILIHEFGHFIVAKLSGIKVEAFSMGFSPILVGIKRCEDGYHIRILPGFLRSQEGDESDGSLATFTIGKKAKPGETEYRIGLIPFGGFVKMLGQEDTSAVEKSDDPRSYANKPVGIRMAVIAAGVLFNVISAVIIFMTVFLIGINQTPPIVGSVKPDSPAARVGLRPGDEIIEIAGKIDDLTFSDIGMAAALSGEGEKIELKVRHADGYIEDIEIVAEKMESSMGEGLRLFGIFSPAALEISQLPEEDEKILFERTGLRGGDRVISVNGKKVENYWEFEEIVTNTLADSVAILAERTDVNDKIVLVESTIKLGLNFKNREPKTDADLGHIYSLVPRLRITAVLEKPVSTIEKITSPSTETAVVDTSSKLQKGDIILAIGDVDNPTYKEIREITEAHEDKELAIKVLRTDSNGVERSLVIDHRPWREKDRVIIGVIIDADAEHPVIAKAIDIEGISFDPKIPRGATITSVNGVGVSNFYDCIREIKRNTGKQVTIDYSFEGQMASSVTHDAKGDNEFITVFPVFAEYIPFKPLERLYKADGPIDAVKMGYRTTVMHVANAYITLQRFAAGAVSAKNFMGPVGIVSVSYRIVKNYPLIYYAHFLGLISAFIAVFNFLPLLPFDGGHIVFLTIEKIKGSPVTERIQEIVLYIGLAAVAVFALYVTFNDILRSLR